jgi:hypothetical protein
LVAKDEGQSVEETGNDLMFDADELPLHGQCLAWRVGRDVEDQGKLPFAEAAREARISFLSVLRNHGFAWDLFRSSRVFFHRAAFSDWAVAS